MVLKRRISFQWRLFLPLVAIIWLLVISIGVWSYYNGRKHRIEQIRSQIDLVSARILSAYEEDFDPVSFLRFVQMYYLKNPLYDQIRVSMYYDGKLLYAVGDEVKLSDLETLNSKGITSLSLENTRDRRGNTNFYYEVARSGDRRLIVYSVLPLDDDVRAMVRGSYSFYIFLLVMAGVATLMAFLMSRKLGHDIKLLRNFALRAGSDPTFVPSMAFSHDEMGDISRQLVRLFDERNTAILKIKREHQVALHAIEDKVRLKRELTNNVNHELKTPIGVIKGYIDTLRDNPDMDPASREHFLTKASEHVERLVTLVNDLSSITRLEFGAKMINVEPLNFHEIVFRCAGDYEATGVLRDMVFNYDVPVTCRIIGNEGLLTGVINNLVKNAVHYSHGTECNLILTGQDDTFYHFAFYDNGQGVKESSLEHLFERFFREDTGRSRKAGGTGLGLPIVLSTIEALGGTIVASNRDGGGLLFRFTLRKAK